MALQREAYRPRDAEHTVLHQVVAEHLEAFLGAVATAGDGAGLPRFVEREFREFLTCGVFEHGVARFRCEGCAREHLVPFSCKGRAWCPSCGGRRMTERAAHLVDAVLPWVPVRQWVLTVPYRLRYQMAWNHGLSRAVLRVYTRVLLDGYARGARARGVPGGRTGSVTVMQRAGSGLNVNLHFLTLVLDGVFTEEAGGGLAFHPAPAPTDAEVTAALATIRHRVQRLLVRRGLEPGDDATGPTDRLVDESPVLAGIVGASVQGRVALGPRAGARVRRLGAERDPATVTSRGPRQAHLGGFDLHANVRVSANDRAGLERLARYVLRPPFAQERLRLRSDGRVALELKTAWRDGTRELVFEPLEFLERLAAMTPRPETNLLICHGVLAPRARWRGRVVAYGRVPPEPTAAAAPLATGPDDAGVQPTPRAWSWAALMHRAFALDVLACAHCGGRLRLIATLHDPAVIRKILAHLALSHSGQSPGPAPPASGAAAS
ncbi:MAG TPA: transposase [Methylomirabilota bacterium]|nr:transposase [Methylomirabilota bacterium]